MHDSEQEHRGITGCRVTYESTIFYNEANKFSIIVVKTSDPRIPPQACNGRYYGDRMLRFTAVGYELPRTKAVELELDGEWVENKYGYQLQVEQWQEIVPQTADGLLAYLGSGLIKGIGPKTAEDIVATFGPDTLNQRHEYIHLEEIELNADRVAQMVTQQTEHFEYMEQQDSFFGGRALTLFRLV